MTSAWEFFLLLKEDAGQPQLEAQMVGGDGQCFAKGGFGLGKPAELYQRVGQMLVQRNIGGGNAQCFAQRGHRVVSRHHADPRDRSEGHIPLGYAHAVSANQP